MATPSVAPQPSAPVPRRGNPLHRRSDSLRVWLRVGFSLALALAVGLTVLLGLKLYADGRAAAARQIAGLHQVNAVAVGEPSSAGVGAWVAPLRWTDAGGVHTANAAVPVSTVSGQHVMLWINAQEDPQPGPIPAVQSAGSAATYSLAAFAAAAMALSGLYALARHRVDSAAWKSWESEWERVEPEWTHRR
ncbi:Rv1733c family protein [Streptacidiphilus rugosus]|uniref:Rv1733c family protein n=1 Tax=Streptacidiphilus rugosus TaxID=405783 RepID=UPI0012FCD3A6|nr:hypothetical protein [Streptacidiphilus rugosus]